MRQRLAAGRRAGGRDLHHRSGRPDPGARPSRGRDRAPARRGPGRDEREPHLARPCVLRGRTIRGGEARNVEVDRGGPRAPGPEASRASAAQVGVRGGTDRVRGDVSSSACARREPSGSRARERVDRACGGNVGQAAAGRGGLGREREGRSAGEFKQLRSRASPRRRDVAQVAAPRAWGCDRALETAWMVRSEPRLPDHPDALRSSLRHRKRSVVRSERSGASSALFWIPTTPRRPIRARTG
jgi:hypothetical protein